MTQRARLGALAIALLVPLLGAQGARADDPTIYVHYTMNCTFSVVGDTGAPIGVIPPGRYQVVVTSPVPFAEPDLSGVTDPNVACGHALSFRLTGPGVDLHTTLEDGDGTGDQFQANFQVGTYVAVEDRRPTVTRTLITVASGAASTGVVGGGSTPSSNTKPSQTKNEGSGLDVFRGWLNGNIATGKPTLRFKGKGVTSLRAGRYTVAVVDQSAKGSFTLQRVGKNAVRITPQTFVGRKVRSITLGPGRWTFYSAPAKKNFFTVTS